MLPLSCCLVEDLEIEVFELAVVEHHHPGLFRVGGVDQHAFGHEEMAPVAAMQPPRGIRRNGGIGHQTKRRLARTQRSHRGRSRRGDPNECQAGAVARTSILHGGRRPATPARGGDLPRIEAVSRSVAARATCASRKSHRSATNLCILTIVHRGAIITVRMIHMRVMRASQQRNAEPGSRSAESRARLVATGADAGALCDGDRCLAVALAAAARRRRAGPMRPAPARRASGLRFGEHGTRTRVVIDLDRPVSFRHVSLGRAARRLVDRSGRGRTGSPVDAAAPVRGPGPRLPVRHASDPACRARGRLAQPVRDRRRASSCRRAGQRHVIASSIDLVPTAPASAAPADQPATPPDRRRRPRRRPRARRLARWPAVRRRRQAALAAAAPARSS